MAEGCCHCPSTSVVVSSGVVGWGGLMATMGEGVVNLVALSFSWMVRLEACTLDGGHPITFILLR